MNKSTLHIVENDEGVIEVYAELDPELTEAQRAGEEELTFPQYITGTLIEAIGQALNRLGMERLESENDNTDTMIE